jgi:hypothetical protein
MASTRFVDAIKQDAKALASVMTYDAEGTAMTPHEWSHPVCIYESCCGFRCKNCDAVCFAFHEGPTADDLKQQGDGVMPADCPATRPLVAQGKFLWDQSDMPPWDDEDVGKWSWPSSDARGESLSTP